MAVNISGISQKAAMTAYAKIDKKPETAGKELVTTGEEQAVKKPNEDTVTISKDYYAKSRLSAEDSEKVEALKEELNRQTEDFTRFIGSMLAKQGEKSNLTLGGWKLNVTPADSAKAAASIAEGGEYSVDAVATRIMDMAKSLSGGDMSKFEVLKDAVVKGFGAAASQLGVEMDKMPPITKQTFDEVMSRFDAWEKEGNA